MAAKSPLAAKPSKAAKSVKSSKTTKSRAHYTAAQSQAYQAASKSAIQNAQTNANAVALRQRRLQGVAKARSKLAAKGVQLYGARIKKLAVSRTYKQAAAAHQSKIVVNTAAAHLFKAQQVATNRQFAYSGEAIHLHTTTLQTLTSAQALSAAKRASALARARAVTAGSKKKPNVTHTRKAKTSRSKYTAVGQAAGRAAAAKVPATRSAPLHRDAPLTDADWIVAGNDREKENCVTVAIANHLLLQTGLRLRDSDIASSPWLCSRIDYMLSRIDNNVLWDGIGMDEYGMIDPGDAKPGDLVGFNVEVGEKLVAHCGVLMEGNQVVSWGEIMDLPSAVDEAWEIVWCVSDRLRRCYSRTGRASSVSDGPEDVPGDAGPD